MDRSSAGAQRERPVVALGREDVVFAAPRDLHLSLVAGEDKREFLERARAAVLAARPGRL